jgi:hypothetical protein
MAWVTGLLGILSPPLIVVPALVLVLRVVLRPNDASAWKALGVGLIGSALAVPMLVPWLAVADLETFITAGSDYWVPTLIPMGAAAVALVAGLLAATGRRLDAIILGGVLTGLGGIVARGVDFGIGRELTVSGLVVVALGSALVVGGVLDGLRSTDVHGWRRLIGGVGSVAAAVLVATTVFPLYGGRAALPNDEFTDPLRFTSAADGEADASRILLVGPAASLPGESRTVRGADYRVVSAPVPALWEVTLPEPRSADMAIESLLMALIDGEQSRAGEALAAFGIRWVVVTGDTPLEDVFAGQLDLISLGGAKRPTFLVDSETAVRALTAAGEPWSRSGTGYEGIPIAGERIFVAESANSRWDPQRWSQSGWGNEVSAATGSVTFDPIESRRSQSYVAVGLGVFLLLFSALARRRR